MQSSGCESRLTIGRSKTLIKIGSAAVSEQKFEFVKTTLYTPGVVTSIDCADEPIIGIPFLLHEYANPEFADITAVSPSHKVESFALITTNGSGLTEIKRAIRAESEQLF